jgi:carboxypeptidase family protein/TonB-dependent receptor-like protein
MEAGNECGALLPFLVRRVPSVLSILRWKRGITMMRQRFLDNCFISFLGVAASGICLLLTPGAVAQLPTATISGVVKDASGALIPAASVTVTNSETGLSREARTATDGSFRFPALAVGSYEVKAEQTGFQSKVQSGLRITIGQEAVLNFTLQVGAVSETVSVSAEAPIVNTTSGTLGSLVSEQTVTDLPLDGRNFNDLTFLQTGVSESRSSDNGGTINGQEFSTNGAPVRSNLFMIDGTIMNDAHGTGASSGNENSLGVEGIREFRVVSNAFSAEYGMTMGSQITLVTKSGTNSFHGSLFEYLRNSTLDARNWTDVSKCPGCLSKPPFRRNNFGGSMGGPIRHDKLFFFLTYEGLRQNRSATSLEAVPNAAAIQGTILNADGTVARTVTVADSVKPYLALFPAPSPDGANLGGGLSRYFLTVPEPQNEDYGQSRVDYTVSSSDNLFGRYTVDNSGDVKQGLVPQVSSSFPARNQFLTLSENHILTPALLATFRGSFSRAHVTALPSISYPTQLAFIPGLPMGAIGITGASGLGPPGVTPVELNQRIFSVSDDMFYTRGKHSAKFGTLINFYRQYLNNTGGANPRGNWSFSNLTNFLIAAPTSFVALTPGSIADRTYDYDTLGFYIQDDLRLRPTLTVNLGLRYEFSTQITEVRGNGAAVVDLQHDADATKGVPPFLNPSLHNFSPRFGFAWDIKGDGKTAVRGGFGLLYDVGVFGSALFVGTSATPPLSSQTTVTPANGLVFGPFPFTAIPPASLAALAGKTLRTVDYHMHQPHLLSYNLAVERQLPGEMGLTVAYAGSRGINIAQNKEGNPTVPLGTPSALNGQLTCLDVTPRPAFVANGPKCYLGNNLDPRTNINYGTVDYRTAGGNSWYNSLQVMLVKRLSHHIQFQSSYTWSHALDETQGQIGVDGGAANSGDDPSNRRYDKGSAGFDLRHSWRFNTIYRFPTGRTGWWGALANGWWASGVLTWNSGVPFNVGTSIQRSRSNTNGPSGSTKRPDLVPGVNIADITRGTSAGCLGVPAGTSLGTPQLFYDPCAFSIPALGFLGTLGRNVLYGPNFHSLNFSLVKDSPLHQLFGESGSLEFRAEIFNILNHPALQVPSGTTVFNGSATAVTDVEAPATGAGQITGTYTKSREIQFALKILF